MSVHWCGLWEGCIYFDLYRVFYISLGRYATAIRSYSLVGFFSMFSKSSLRRIVGNVEYIQVLVEDLINSSFVHILSKLYQRRSQFCWLPLIGTEMLFLWQFCHEVERNLSFDNFWFSEWRKFRQNDIPVSVFTAVNYSYDPISNIKWIERTRSGGTGHKQWHVLYVLHHLYILNNTDCHHCSPSIIPMWLTLFMSEWLLLLGWHLWWIWSTSGFDQ